MKKQRRDQEDRKGGEKRGREKRGKWDTCTPMFIAALFTIARSWKQSKCPSTDEWIKKM